MLLLLGDEILLIFCFVKSNFMELDLHDVLPDIHVTCLLTFDWLAMVFTLPEY